MKTKQKAFTIVELLTVLAIMALLVGILIPSVNVARNMARAAKQRAQFVAIDIAIISFKNDNGDYPPSFNNADGTYYGAQKLAEALLGWDLRGFHKYSRFEVSDNLNLYNSEDTRHRKGPYLDVSTSNAFKLNDIFDIEVTDIYCDSYVICDVYTQKKKQINDQLFNIGLPILYYKANISGGELHTAKPIYDKEDNYPIIALNGDGHPLFDDGGSYFWHENYKIIDPRIFESDGRRWPHRADSYILISAGFDGLYGTTDDMFNF